MDIKNLDHDALLAAFWHAPNDGKEIDDLWNEILSRMQGWVSVDTALPDEGVGSLWLCCTKVGGRLVLGRTQRYGWVRFRKTGGFDVYDKEVTHWMPLPALPQPPKEG